MKNIFHVVYDDVEALDFVGSHDVFAMACYVHEQTSSENIPFKQYVISHSCKPIKTAEGITITPDFSFDQELPKVDIIVIPGGPNVRDIERNDPMIEWIKNYYNGVTNIMAVCLGAFPLIEALGNLLNEHQLTTHHLALDSFETRLQELNIDAKVERGARYIYSGKVITTAGVSAGIDGAFYLLNVLKGDLLTAETAKIMEYNRTINWTEETKLPTYKQLKY